jgi:hypothetical protein
MPAFETEEILRDEAIKFHGYEIAPVYDSRSFTHAPVLRVWCMTNQDLSQRPPATEIREWRACRLATRTALHPAADLNNGSLLWHRTECEQDRVSRLDWDRSFHPDR